MHGGGMCVLRQDTTNLNCSKKDGWEDSGISNTSSPSPPKQARQISNRSKRSKVGSDWEKGIDNKTAWKSYLRDFILNMHSL